MDLTDVGQIPSPPLHMTPSCGIALVILTNRWSNPFPKALASNTVLLQSESDDRLVDQGYATAAITEATQELLAYEPYLYSIMPAHSVPARGTTSWPIKTRLKSSNTFNFCIVHSQCIVSRLVRVEL